MRTFLQALALCAAGAALGLGANRFTPRPAPFGVRMVAAAELPGATCHDPATAQGLPRISVDQAAPLCVACTAAFVDARTEPEYAAGHVTGAFHLGVGEDPAKLLPRLAGYGTVIVYDRDASCAQADQVAAALAKGGAKDVRVLTGAWPAWVEGGGPGASGSCSLCNGGGK